MVFVSASSPKPVILVLGKGHVSTRGLSDVDIEWEEWKGDEKKSLTPEPKEKENKEEGGPVVG